jgi:ribosomal protein S5
LNFTALVICGNGDGVAGFGKGKSAEVSAAVDKVCYFIFALIFITRYPYGGSLSHLFSQVSAFRFFLFKENT